MPGDKKHHSEKWHKCVEEVMAKGHDESSASAICTKSLQDAGEPIYEAAEAHLESLHLCGATGTSHTEMRDGKEYLVVPVVALIEGVLHPVNAATPEMVPLATIKRAASSWNGRPLTLGHPAKNGRQCSANDPEIYETHAIGTVYNARVEGRKLLCDAYVDKVKVRRLHPQLLADLEANKVVEVSVGSFVVTSDQGGEYNGRSYKATWLEASGDHLAMLPGGRGACSCADGCGTNRAAEAAPMHLVTAEAIEYDPIFDLAEKFVAAAKTQLQECVACKGTGSVNGNPCEACDGNGEIRVAAGARHSTADLQMIQAVHDHAMRLGAMCSRQNLETASAPVNEIRYEGGKYVVYSADKHYRLAEYSVLKEAEAHRDAIQRALAAR